MFGFSTHPAAVARQKRNVWVGCVGLLMLVGCAAKPNAANIELRKQNQDLNDQIQQLNQKVTTLEGTLATMNASTPTVPVLPAERMNELFTVHSLKVGRLSGFADLPDNKSGIKVYVVPLDASGDELKAAGAFTIEAFDLSASDPRIGQWSFTVDEARASWLGSGLLYEYVLVCPFAKPIDAQELTLKITFTDALTQRVHRMQQVITRQG